MEKSVQNRKKPPKEESLSGVCFYECLFDISIKETGTYPCFFALSITLAYAFLSIFYFEMILSYSYQLQTVKKAFFISL